MKSLCFLAFILLVQLTCRAQITSDPNAPKQVAVFLSCECPISQKYIPVLNEIYRKYGDKSGLEWKFVVTGGVSRKELKAFVEEYQVAFPVEREDGNHSLTRNLNATVTPQVFIKGEEVLYSGAIDNWFYELGQYRQIITEHYFTDALDNVLSGKVPAIRETEPVGCPIAKRQ